MTLASGFYNMYKMPYLAISPITTTSTPLYYIPYASEGKKRIRRINIGAAKVGRTDPNMAKGGLRNISFLAEPCSTRGRMPPNAMCDGSNGDVQLPVLIPWTSLP